MIFFFPSRWLIKHFSNNNHLINPMITYVIRMNTGETQNETIHRLKNKQQGWGRQTYFSLSLQFNNTVFSDVLFIQGLKIILR